MTHKSTNRQSVAWFHRQLNTPAVRVSFDRSVAQLVIGWTTSRPDVNRSRRRRRFATTADADALVSHAGDTAERSAGRTVGQPAHGDALLQCIVAALPLCIGCGLMSTSTPTCEARPRGLHCGDAAARLTYHVRAVLQHGLRKAWHSSGVSCHVVTRCLCATRAGANCSTVYTSCVSLCLCRQQLNYTAKPPWDPSWYRLKEQTFHLVIFPRSRRMPSLWQTSTTSSTSSACGNAFCPRVQPFYAVKCNEDPCVLRLLAQLGTGFDCASKVEIERVLDMKVNPNRIVYANPCKQTSYIKYAATHGVSMMTFDNEAELYKIKSTFPNSKLVIRLKPPESKSLFPLGIKFGCDPIDAGQLLRVAKELDLNVIGVSFHVGSGCCDVTAFSWAVASAHSVFQMAEDIGFHFDLPDLLEAFLASGRARSPSRRGKCAVTPVTYPWTTPVPEPGVHSYSSSFWGPTCNGFDCIKKQCLLPELNIGDWLVFRNMGAYTTCMASEFNGMPKPHCYHTIHESCW
ncbi:Ornithine decarboxylase [Lamellibrachia satsuma]|nr:Ornithine decarboxylase [Lamellibrachia satsuma]